MNKENLINTFNKAKALKTDIAIEVTIPGQETTEVNINRNENLDNKLEFYKKAYDDNCVHCMNKEVRIVNANCIDFFSKYNETINNTSFEVRKEG